MWLVPCLLLVALSGPGTSGPAPTRQPGGGGQEFRFRTRGEDACTARTGGPGEARLRVQCRRQDGAYWCEYRGQPRACPAFAANPRAYWEQALQALGRLRHACRGVPALRPAVCLEAGPAAHLRQVASSLEGGSPAPRQLPAATASARPGKGSPLRSHPAAKAIQAAAGPGSNEAETTARALFWQCLQAIYASIISFFRG
ncbi:fibroblast growth factor-binding protein 2 [Dasypus novemcinctus]|uniref:fibroblast growth factor-binding protein 2 n=1 Tax=Dasypus novemcinctus TaxID=9361 RepID=UPI00265D9898|nr:fibroblast growth factor-binding protein 2 [Dasypus novemcinctus]